jgi:hypothetical protein
MPCRYYCLARHASVVGCWDRALVDRILRHVPGVDSVRPPPDEEQPEQQQEEQPEQQQEEQPEQQQEEQQEEPAVGPAEQPAVAVAAHQAGPAAAPCDAAGDHPPAAPQLRAASGHGCASAGAEEGEGRDAPEAGGDGSGKAWAEGGGEGRLGASGERRPGIRSVSYVDLNRTRAKWFRHCRPIREFLDPDGPGRWGLLPVPDKDLAKWKG